MGGANVSSLASESASSLKVYWNKTSTLLLLCLVGVHILGTVVAYTFYIKVSSLGDGYAPKDFQGFDRNISEFTSTFLVHGIYSITGKILPSFFAPMALGVLVAVVTWHAFRGVYSQTDKKIFWICNLFPHFLIWSGSSSKEQIVLIFGIIVIGLSAKQSFGSRKLNTFGFLLILFSLCIILFIRPNYFVIYFTIFLTSMAYQILQKLKINRFFSVGIWILAVALIVSGVISYISIYTTIFSHEMIDWMNVVEMSFLSYDAGSNRTNIQWENVSDFLLNSIWGIPQGFIGPTLSEALSKPIQLPVFLEGVVYLIVLIYLFFKLFNLAYSKPSMRFHILPFLFVALAIIYVSYPYLIFNAGSSLRYKQSMHPVLLFYPLLILAYFRANYASEGSVMKQGKGSLSDKNMRGSDQKWKY